MTRSTVLFLFALLALVYATGSAFGPVRTVKVTRELTPTEIELLLKAVGKKYGGVCL